MKIWYIWLILVIGVLGVGLLAPHDDKQEPKEECPLVGE